jgi:hypothetical protein
MAGRADGPLRIVVLGYLVRGPLGGHAWHHLHYVAGLAGLGHDVWFIEDSDDYPSCYHPLRDRTGTDPTYGLEFARHAFGRVGLEDRWAYHDAHSRSWAGPASAEALGVCASADVVLNLSGANPLRPWLEQVPVRVLIDTDPGFTQAQHLADESVRERALAHTEFFTFGQNVGRSSLVPDDGMPWKPTRQPVVLDHWPELPAPDAGAFTTVMVWESYRPVEADGLRLGLKAQSFEPYLGLPRLSPAPLELAIGGPTAPRALLEANGWRIVDPREPTRTLGDYRRYIASSLGEFAIAKHGYVATHSGWFSERSANYLVTGRPVVAQDTGFSESIPTGEGLFGFSSPDEALAALDTVMTDPNRHRVAAREIGAAHFDSRVVLARLLEDALAHPTVAAAE